MSDLVAPKPPNSGRPISPGFNTAQLLPKKRTGRKRQFGAWLELMRRSQGVYVRLRWSGGRKYLGTYSPPTGLLDLAVARASQLDLETLQRLLVADKSMRDK